MKKTLKLTFLGLMMTIFSFSSGAKVIGKIINGIPVVLLTNEEVQTQLNDLSQGAYSNVLLKDMRITFNPNTSGFLIITYTYNEEGVTGNQKNSLSIELIYDEGANEFKIMNGGRKKICASFNCVAGCDMTYDGCTPCERAEDESQPTTCKEVYITNNWPWIVLLAFILYLVL